MDLFIVFVVVHQDRRYVDSCWSSEDSAKERAGNLNTSLKSCIGESFINAAKWHAIVSKFKLEDARLEGAK